MKKHITNKPQTGTIVRWFDAKGYGFIRSGTHAEDVYFHISDYHVQGKRPSEGETVVFVSQHGQKGRLMAVQVQNPQAARIATKQHRNTGKGSDGIRSSLLAVGLWVVLLPAAVWVDMLPFDVFIWYGIASTLAFFLYWHDKTAARNGRWRTPENTLHLAALAGGWPGALLAQDYLRHKSQKQPFRTVFSITVALNIVLLVYLSQHGFYGWL
ncbi:DUF1294 domain-containing protein [Neisseria sp.]|uniref:DUF1294 domain-containing protein n=1 Tax=Neisseria sp. TaxID=192066 RepID=UPI0035A10AC6